MAGSAASKKRKDKRKPTKRGGAPAPGGGDEAADAPSSVETSTPSETQSTRPQPAPKPRSALSMATKVGAGGEETAGKSASEPPTKRNVPAAASPSTGGDTSDASGVQQTTSPRPGKGGKATTKGPRPQREKPERSPLQTTSGAAASAAATEDKLDGSAVDTTTERRPARSTPRSSAKESSVSSSTSSAKDTSATALDVTADSASSKTTSLPNERPVRERGTRTTLRQQRIEESASSKMTAREKPTYGERGQRQPPQYQQGDSQQGGPNTDITGDGVSDRSARSTRGAGVGAGSSLSRVFGAAKNGQSSLDARAARQEALRRERELRRQQHTQEDTTPDGETKHPEADESSTVATTRAKDPSTRPSRPEGGSYRRPSTAEYTRGEEGPGAGERDKNDSTTSSTLAADRKGADGHGSWREVKAPGAASSRFGSTQRPPRPERKEGFGTGSKVWKDGFFANSMICYMTWEEMKLRPDVIESIHRYGLKHPSNVQKLALVPFAEGKDIIAQAQSQNDRTNTFAIGALQRLKKNVKRCQAVVICSDRVQPQQVFKDLERWFEGTGLRCVMLNDTSNEELQKLYGPAATTAEAAAATTETRQPPQVAVTTLGRLAEVMDQGLLELNTIDTIGICMAQHELIDFEAFKKLWPKLSRKAQVVMMTGIMLPRLRSIKVQNFRQNTVVLRADELTLKWSEHYVIRLESQDQRWPTLVDIFQKNKTITHTVIVTSSNSVTQLLVSRLKELGMPAHGIWSMADKVQMAELFNKPDDCVLVVESALTAELDLDHDSLVINYEMPWRASHYISIFGLFGRSGLRTMMVNLLLNNKPEESAMLEELENLYDIKIAEMKLA
ncbi:translation initiation factor eIF4A [Actinomortierella ambigua]|nr:translation initiation factor eIF4A [Actinomortierella ambigua]